MRLKLKYLYLLFIGLALTSCFNKFDEANPNELPTEFTKLSDADRLLTATYNALYNQSLMGFTEAEINADMAFAGGWTRFGQPTAATLTPYYWHTFTNTGDAPKSRWAAIYTGLFRANQTIKVLNDLVASGTASEEDEQWVLKMCQARFFRGLFHMYAHEMFNGGDIILVETVPVTKDEIMMPLCKSEDVLKSFRADFQYTIDNWPADLDPKDYEVARVNNMTALAHLGMSQLYEEEWEEASKTFMQIIENPVYELVTDYTLMFTPQGEFNSESIFEINYQNGVHDELSNWATNNTINSWNKTSVTSFSFAAWVTYMYENEPFNKKDPRNIVLDRDSTLQYQNQKVVYWRDTLPKDYDADGNYLGEQRHGSVDGTGFERFVPANVTPADQARYRRVSHRASWLMVSSIDYDQRLYVGSTSTAMQYKNSAANFGYSRKFLNWYNLTKEDDLPIDSNHSGKNVVLLRLPAIYLMYAEAQAMLGNTEKAIYYVNLIRDRWALKLVGSEAQNPTFDAASHEFGTEMDQAAIIEHIRHTERPMELCQEGYCTRFIDLRRWQANKKFPLDMKQRYLDLSKPLWGVIPSGIDDTGVANQQLTPEAATNFYLTGPASWGRQLLGIMSGDINDINVYSKFPMPSTTSMSWPFHDHEVAAKNYDPEQDNYWPIPLDEILNNPALESKGVKVHYR